MSLSLLLLFLYLAFNASEDRAHTPEVVQRLRSLNSLWRLNLFGLELGL